MAFRIFLFLILSNVCFAQTTLNGKISDAETALPLENVEILVEGQKRTQTNADGTFSVEVEADVTVSFVLQDYQIQEYTASGNSEEIEIALQPIVALTTIEVQAHKKREFALRRMQDVEGTSILAGKKNEVVLLEQLTANMATNNARQIYGQVVGLNIFDYNDGGLQLGIGGRGLDPNRTANFNTRQNGYDISADVLGYPESYYTPAAEALKEIQIIRGAASLQYGTQFGGLINFKFKQPNPNKKFEFITRNTLGSNQLYTNFSSVSGTVGKLGYYGFFNYKNGNSFRPNSGFESFNYFAHLDYQLSEKTKIGGEFTHFNYLAQQPGGLTDAQFQQNPDFSNRERNWFQVDWNLFDLNIEHDFTEKSKFSTHIFGLQSQRDALGFRTNRVSQPDEATGPRDLIQSKFKNWGFESRFLQKYQWLKQEQVFLIGAKYYDANNKEAQGPGTRAGDADFTFDYAATPDYPSQVNLDLPNTNFALFGETILKLSDKFSITPGIRYEWINTQAQGTRREVIVDLSGNVLSEEILPIAEEKKRDFVLLGIGASYRNKNVEYYSNFSQNYRSVTFSDIFTTNTNRAVAANIKDETGYTFDIGARGNFKKWVSYDANVFSLYYDDKIGNYISSEGKNTRDNIGTAWILGLEFFTDLDLDEIIQFSNKNVALNFFVNAAITHSEYINTNFESLYFEGNKLERVPTLNIKTGVGFGYKNFTSQIQLTHFSEQFTDALNTSVVLDSPFSEGIIGQIPAYTILDFSAGYTYKRYKLEASINNLLNNKYFVRRADGYPGPGIIPSEPLNWTITLQVKL